MRERRAVTDIVVRRGASSDRGLPSTAPVAVRDASAPESDTSAELGPPATAAELPSGAASEPEQIARASRSSFLGAFLLLRPERRAALAAVYAFCRVVDDAGDDAPDAERAREGLAFWNEELAAIEHGRPCTPIGRGVAAAVRDYGVDPADLREVIAGVAMDVEPRRYADLDELDGYCRKVASAVGLACLPVFGASSPESRRYADELGLALQLTNILRDLREDARVGRVYVPADRLAAHGVQADWLSGEGPAAVYSARGPVDQLVSDLVAVARARFVRAAAELPEVDRRALLPARVMGEVYAALLTRVARRGGRLDRGARVRVPRAIKLAILARAFLRSRFQRRR